jgi:transposase
VVQNYLAIATKTGLNWPLPGGMDEGRLQALLSERRPVSPAVGRELPEMAYLHSELKRKGVTLQLLWEEYRRDHAECYSYPQFCRYYREWAGKLEPTIRQAYRAGEKAFVDWAGPTIPVHDPVTGEVLAASLFVAVLGASNYTYAEAFANRQLPSWIEGHIHCYEFFGGVPVLTVADNEKTGTTYPSRYEPGLNPSYQDMGSHYGTVMLPTRPGKARDKAKVEAAVLFAERWIIAALRHQTFFSLQELNRAIRELLVRLNDRPFKKLAGSRRSVFEQLDRPALRPLPERRYELAEWRKARVNIDYHVQVDNHFYSVPYRLVHARVDVRLTARAVELLHNGIRVAAHVRSYERGKATTDPAHRPKSHQQHLEWTPGRLIHWAQNEVGQYCAQVVKSILKNQPHPEMGYRACLGLMRLGRLYGKMRLEQACSYRSIKSMLQTGLDRQPLANMPQPPIIRHLNLRGADYFMPPADLSVAQQEQKHDKEEIVCLTNKP